MSTDFYNAPNHANAMLSQLGIDVNNISPSIDPANQPKQIGKEVQKKSNKYIDRFLEEAKQFTLDQEIPNFLPAKSTVKKKVKQEPPAQKKDNQPLGRKKQSKREQLKKQKVKNDANHQKKEEVKIDIELDEVAQWGEKGTKFNQDEQQQEDFDEYHQDQKGAENEQQQTIRKNIEQKLKKYENPGSINRRNEDNKKNGLQSKAEELKKKNEVVNKKESLEQSTQQLVQKKVTNAGLTKWKEEQQEQSEDPWQKINKETLNQKKGAAQALMAAAEMDLNKYYQKLALPDSEDIPQQQPKTGIFQTLCACLSSKNKPNTEVQRQIIKVSKIQLTNKPEQVTLLKAIWTKLTHKKYLRYGEHWSQVGFQGRDPATDLRSTGILSLLHWNSFIQFDHQFCKKAFNFCTQFDLPLALTHIKVTSLLCSCLKKRLLSGKNWSDYLEWYYALCYYTFQYIFSNGKNLDQVGELVEKSIQRTKNELQSAKKYFNIYIKQKR